MRPAIPVVCLALALLAGCSKDKPSEAVSEVEIGADLLTEVDGRMVRRDTGQVFSGTVVRRNPNGIKLQTESFKDGRRHGLARTWFPDGKLRHEVEWLEGQKHGAVLEKFASGKKKLEGQFEHGQPTGVFKEWGSEGKREWELSFVNGVRVEKKIVRNDDLKLPEKERKYLWDTEHHGALMRKHGFAALKNALQARDRESLAVLMSGGFKGFVPRQGNPVSLDLGVAKASRLEVAANGQRPVDADGFVDWLLDEFSVFEGNAKVKLSLMTYSPVQREVIEGDWIGRVKLRAWDQNATDGLDELTLYLDWTLAFPGEENLTRGQWLRECRVSRVKQASADQFMMKDVAAAIGLPTGQLHDNWKHGPEKTITNTGGIFACDFNRDGITDLLVTDIKPGPVLRSYLFKGVPGGRMVDVTTEVGLGNVIIHIAAFADLDGDGWEDLVSGQGHIYRNVQGRRFENVTGKSNLAQAGDLIRHGGEAGFAIADYDRDGQVDLYIFRNDSKREEGSWIGGKIGPGAANQLMRNLGNWQFEDVTTITGTDGGKRSTFTSVWLDANNDNWPDLYVINEYGNGVLLINQGRGKPFRAMELMDKAADFGSMGLTVGDFNNDGQVDIYVASMYSKSGSRVIGNLHRDAYKEDTMRKLDRMVAGSQLYRNLGGLKFEPVGKALDVVAVGWAYGPSLVDLDNDGFLDIHATTGFISRTRDKPDG